MPAPADRYGSANHLHFRTHPLLSAGPSGDRVRRTGLPSAINTEMRPRVSCSAGKQVVTRPGESRYTAEPVFLTDIRGSTRKHVKKKADPSWNTTQHWIHKKKNTKLSQANKSTKSCSCSPDRLTQLPPLFTLCFPFFWFLRRIILEELLFLWPLIDNAMTNAGLRLKFKKKKSSRVRRYWLTAQ